MNPAIPASTQIVARLKALMDERAITPEGLSRTLGWGHGQMRAKLAPPVRADGTPNPVYRPMRLQEIDEVLAALGLDAPALFSKPTR